MEIFIVVALLLCLGLYSVFGLPSLIVWVFIFIIFVIARTRHIRCRECGRYPIAIRDMRFCGRCGAEQVGSPIFRLRCAACGRLLRNELRMDYCGICGAKGTSTAP